VRRSAASISLAKSLTLASTAARMRRMVRQRAPRWPRSAAHEGGVYPQPLGDLFLGHPGALSERAEGLPEDELILLDRRF
jgi:hypothetical protein